MPLSDVDLDYIQTKHAKVIGFIESRIKNFLSLLQFSLGGLSIQDGLIYNKSAGDVVFVPGSPFKTSDLSSCFVVSLPFTRLSQSVSNLVLQACVSFDCKLANYIEIGGWVQHSSSYQIVNFNELPVSVLSQYTSQYLNHYE